MQEPLTWISFRDVAWLQAFQLTPDTIFTYLSISQFYDRTCNNEVVFMQTRFTTNTEAMTQKERLQTMVGIEYSLHSSQAPSFFLLHKVHRNSPTSTTLLQVLYVMQGTIYMAPTLESVIHYRMSSIMYNLNKAWDYCNGFVIPDISTNSIKIKTNENKDILHPKDLLDIKEMTQINSAYLSVINKTL